MWVVVTLELYADSNCFCASFGSLRTWEAYQMRHLEILPMGKQIQIKSILLHTYAA